MNDVVIIGLGAAGYAALMTLKRISPKASIVVIDPKKSDLNHPCGLPYSLEGVVDEKLLSADLNLERMGVKRYRYKAVKINPADKKIESLNNGETQYIDYDKILITTGSIPVVPPIKGAKEFLNKGLYTLANLKDLNMIKSNITSFKNASVIGAGAIGLETAVALLSNGIDVKVFEAEDRIFKAIFDADISEAVMKYLNEAGINISLNARVEAFTGGEKVEALETAGGVHKTDSVVMAAGFRADTQLAESSGIDFDAGGIIVNSRMETSVENVYAAGDAVRGWSVIDKKSNPIKLATSAYKQGITAAYSLAGLDAVYKGSAGTFVSKISGLEIAGTGFNMQEARERGFDPVAGKIKSSTLPDYFPGGSDITIKIIADKKSALIIGGQIFGTEGAASRINLISMAIESGMSLGDFQMCELAYCPAVSEVHDPVFKAAEFCERRIK